MTEEQKRQGEELRALAREACARFSKLTSEEKRAMLREQRISWVYGQLSLSGREITREEVTETVDAYYGYKGT